MRGWTQSSTGSDQLSSSFKKVEHDSSYDVENDLIRERNEEIIQLQRDFTDLAEVSERVVNQE